MKAHLSEALGHGDEVILGCTDCRVPQVHQSHTAIYLMSLKWPLYSILHTHEISQPLLAACCQESGELQQQWTHLPYVSMHAIRLVAQECEQGLQVSHMGCGRVGRRCA